MHGDAFEWDEAKAQSNLAKHGVSFVAASRVFDDLFASEEFDQGSEPSEVRYIITGMVNGVILTVVYTERDERARIISAKKATRHEQQNYYRNQTSE